ncbi:MULTISPECIES: YiiG family protein [unclassified Methylobacterium]|uniref:YiiG family protein n=1 Tax=unclassified Methylobacterium TaxID=2615210 RepID=UPI0006FBB622|nr:MULTISPECIES: YiiG family protein [unclassified Methylobacterium]KQP58150.1 hypothetical protein ASF39_18270 [Methylobacterium sp. Leaf108]KQT87166.1 hypothetical protein ASG59_16265 [Methylobacterium sp. Leaf466]
MTFPTRRAVFLAVFMGCVPAFAQTSVPAGPETVASQAVIRKLNAYVGLLNRTLRASESMARYGSWVNMQTGPTGRESIVYGLYSLYDVRDEIAKAKAAVSAEPRMAELDAAIPPYVAAYETLAPLIAQANGYYERADYKVDKMAEGKTLHGKLAPAGNAFLEERAKLEPLFAREKLKSDEAELALIEKQEGRKARWIVANVMLRARPVVELLPREARPIVDLPAFDAALATYASAVRSMDEYTTAEPGSFSGFEGRPASWLGKLREFREKLGRAKGDARRGRIDTTWIVNDYNTLISSSQTATRFPR